MKALRIVWTLCLVALFAQALMLTCYRSELNEVVWLFATGHSSEGGHPDVTDAEFVVVTLVSVLFSAAIVRRILPVETSRTKALRIVGKLCWIGLLAQALILAWYRSGLGDLVWVSTVGHDLEGYPSMADADFAVVTLVSVLISAAIVRRILRWRAAA
jgi:membrane-anchored protein YejM (alkaline phosphatase superfamily)